MGSIVICDGHVILNTSSFQYTESESFKFSIWRMHSFSYVVPTIIKLVHITTNNPLMCTNSIYHLQNQWDLTDCLHSSIQNWSEIYAVALCTPGANVRYVYYID